MRGLSPLPALDADLRPPSALADLSAFMPRGPLGRLNDALDYTGPILYGVAAWLAACRLTWMLRAIKPTDDTSPYAELDVAA